MCKMVKYLRSKSVAERESSVSGGCGKSNERAKLLLLSPPLPQHPEKNFRSVSSLPVSHFQDSQKIDLLTPSFNFPEKVHFFRVKELYFIETLPKAQRTRGLSSYHKFHKHLDQTSISESQLSINLKISTKHQHLS